MGDTVTLTHKEVSKRGGDSFLNKYGKETYSEMGKKGIEGKLKKYGPDYFKNLAKKGLITRYKNMLKKGTITQEQYDDNVKRLLE